jgi:PAS domain S-box-containing protein
MSENTVDRADVDRYRRLIDAITDYAIYMLDIDGYVSSWNPGARRFKGYEADEILGQHFSRFYTPEDRAAGVPERALRTAAAEGRFDTEGWRVRKDGQRFWAHVVIDPIRDESGLVVGFAKITRDLTERMLARSALEQAQHALFQTQKLESIGKLTGGIAHDFNNLLTAVIVSLELLRKQLPRGDERAHGLLDNALHGAERGSALTQRMLAFARRQELNMKAVRLRPLVDGMLDMLDRSLGPTIKLITDIPESLPPAHTDVNQLETALLNLALNARDAMGESGTIRIFAHEVSKRRRHSARSFARPLCRDFSDGRRPGHGRGHACARDRTILHDQRHRQGHRTRPVDGAGLDGAIRRTPEHPQRERRRYHGYAVAAGRRGRHRIGDRRACRHRRAAAGRYVPYGAARRR